jgi:hypothetical protein
MDKSELESLLADVEELKRAVRRNNPFLREVVSSRLFSAMSLPLGLLLVAFCAGTQLLVARHGSFGALPTEWKIASGLFFGLYFAVAGVLKWIHLNRKARSVDEGANFLTILNAVYGGSWLHLNVPAIVCMLFSVGTAILSGHPWYAVTGAAIFIVFPFNSLGLMVQRAEYLAMGWYFLASGLTSLFFIETMPFAWSGIVWGGGFLVFGIVGLATQKRRASS